MAKVTSKLQVTIPKALADRSGIRPGDDIEWSESGEGLRIAPSGNRPPLSIEERLSLFDQATERQKKRQRGRNVKPAVDRGWSREDLYHRGRSR